MTLTTFIYRFGGSSSGTSATATITPGSDRVVTAAPAAHPLLMLSMSESMTAVAAAPNIPSIVRPLPLPTSTAVTIAFEQPYIASASINASLSSPVAQNPESTEPPAPASVLPPVITGLQVPRQHHKTS